MLIRISEGTATLIFEFSGLLFLNGQKSENNKINITCKAWDLILTDR